MPRLGTGSYMLIMIIAAVATAVPQALTSHLWPQTKPCPRRALTTSAAPALSSSLTTKNAMRVSLALHSGYYLAAAAAAAPCAVQRPTTPTSTLERHNLWLAPFAE